MNGGHFPGLVPVSESDERLNVVTRASLLPQHSYPLESTQTTEEYGIPPQRGDDGAWDLIAIIDSVESESQPPSHYPEMEVGPFHCDLCDRTIKRQSDFLRHLKTTVRHGGRHIICPNCERSYTRPSTLRRHICRGRQSKRP